ncbi:MAG: HDOD domain-containing protein [Verrucomicrobiota bacterium]
MSAALSALFRGWWVRLFVRPIPAAPAPARREPLPETREPVPAVADVATAAPAKVTAEVGLRADTLEKLRQLRQIPALQSLAQGFLRAAARSDGSIEEVVAAVERDPALCVRVLRMANSAFVNPEQKITDIATAVQMLGLRRVNTLTHALFTLREARSPAGGVDWRHLWVHALATAALAEVLEEQLGRRADPQLYLAALLHDVGKIVLSTVAPEAYRAIMDRAWAGEGRLDALEQAGFGLGHAEAGVVFAQQCGLPDEVVAAIGHHGDPVRADRHRQVVALVSIANHLAKLYGLGFSGARLDESDGDLETQPAWAVIAEETGATPDIELIAEAVRGRVAGLKQELQSVRDAA